MSIQRFLFYFEGVLCIYTHYTPSPLNYYDRLHLSLIYVPSHVSKYELPCFSVPALFSHFPVSSILFTFGNRYTFVSIFQNMFQMLCSLWIFGIHCLKVGLFIWTPNFRYVSSVNHLLTFCSCRFAHSLQQVWLKCLAKFCSPCLWKCIVCFLSVYTCLNLNMTYCVTYCIAIRFFKAIFLNIFTKCKLGISGVYIVLA